MIDGIINVYKQPDWTSNDCVCKLKGVLHQKKIGHGGTLDPDAEGVLPVTLGKGTRLFDYVTTRKKKYRATVKFGITTDTQDSSGTVLTRTECNITTCQVKEILPEFVGKIKQVPPMYSALKRDGKRLCDIARKGETVALEPREIEIENIELIDEVKDNVCHIDVTCGKGTYIRTLCNDIGEKLGCGAIMEHLVRLSAAGMNIEHALTIAQIEEKVKNNDFSFVTPIDEAIDFYPAVKIDESQLKKLENGNSIDAFYASGNTDGLFRIYCNNRFFGIGEKQDENIKVKCFLGERT